MLVQVDIRLIWEDIKAGVLKIYEDSPWNDWRPEDIYSSCISGESMLLVQSGVPPQKSFLVVRLDTAHRTGERVLNLWLAWSPDETGAKAVFKELEDLARSYECEAIEFLTAEDKVKEHGAKFGFDKCFYHLRKELRSSPKPIEPMST